MSKYISTLLIIAFAVMVNAQVRPPPVVTQQVVVAPFSDSVTIVGVDLGGTGSKVKVLLGSVSTVCQTNFPGQLSFLVQNTTIICSGFFYDLNAVSTIEALDISITVDGTTHVSPQMLLYIQSPTSCVGGPTGNVCNSPDTCSYGICQCASSSVGPLCSLDQVYSTAQSGLTKPQFKYIYQTGFLDWDIYFNELNVWDSTSQSFVLLKDLSTGVTWTVTTSGTSTVIYTSSYIDTVAGAGIVKIAMKFASSLYQQVIGDYTTDVEPNSMQFNVQVLGLPNSDTTPYQVGFKIETDYTNPLDTQDVDYVSHYYNDDSTDTRWFTFTKNSVSLYGRYPSRCIADNGDILQSCTLDLDVNPTQQSIGNGQFYINFPVFDSNSQTWFDLLIVNNTAF